MKINRIIARNVKGRDFNFELAPLTLIVGDNFSGKTTIALALRLGLAGYLPPPIGKLPGAIYSLAGNPDAAGKMSIELHISEQPCISHRWKRGETGQVKYTGNVPQELRMPDVLLDTKTFFALTEAERVKTIFARCNVREFNVENLIKHLSDLEVLPTASTRPIIEKFIASKRHFLDSEAALQFKLDELLESAKTQIKVAKAEEKIFAAKMAGAAWRGPEPKDRSKEINEISQTRETLILKRQQLKIFQQLLSTESEDAVELDQLNSRLPTLASDDSEARRCVEKRKLESDSLRKRHAQVENEVRNYQQHSENQRIKMKLGLQHQVCPFCRSSDPGWKESFKNTIEAELVDIGVDMRNAIQHLDDVQRELTAADQLLATEMTRFKQVEQQTQERRIIEVRIKEIKNRQDQRNQLIPIENVGIPADIENDILALDEELKHLRNAQAQFDSFMEMRKNRLSWESDLVRSRNEQAAMTAISKTIADEQIRIIGQAFTPVLAITDKFTINILNSLLEFRNGEIGRRVTQLDQESGNTAAIGSWISYRGFSGVEETLAYIAFAVALSAQTKIKIVILDEMGRLTDDRKQLVIQRMNNLIKLGTIDQCIAIDVSSREYEKLCDISIIEL